MFAKFGLDRARIGVLIEQAVSSRAVPQGETVFSETIEGISVNTFCAAYKTSTIRGNAGKPARHRARFFVTECCEPGPLPAPVGAVHTIQGATYTIVIEIIDATGEINIYKAGA